METIEDVLREMRDAANLSPSAIENYGFLLTDNFYDDECQGWLTHYADHIEKAYNLEIATLISKVKGIQGYLSQPMKVDDGWADACMAKLEDAAMKLANMKEENRGDD